VPDAAHPSLALVTGASSGIGEAYARTLARRGCDLVLVARRRDRLENLAAALGGSGGVAVEVLAADLTDAADLATVVERLDGGPPVDLLVNNAGFGTAAPLVDIDPRRLGEEVGLNVTALVALTRAALPGMVERCRGAVVNVSSVVGFTPVPRLAVYAATKAFVTSFTEAVAEEVRSSGVRVQALCPGLTRTEFQTAAGSDESQRPDVLWQRPEQVVAASLAGLERNRILVVPGLHNRALVAGSALLPRSVRRRLTAAAQERR
jgi:uncharacterized protein